MLAERAAVLDYQESFLWGGLTRRSSGAIDALDADAAQTPCLRPVPRLL